MTEKKCVITSHFIFIISNSDYLALYIIRNRTFFPGSPHLHLSRYLYTNQ